jgi:hypothetical protein
MGVNAAPNSEHFIKLRLLITSPSSRFGALWLHAMRRSAFDYRGNNLINKTGKIDIFIINADK